MKIDTSDKLVQAMHDAMKMREFVVIARSAEFDGDLETILKALDQKKADYLLYSLEDVVRKDERQEFLYGLKEAMENGHKVVINIDYKLAKEPKEFITSFYSLTDALPARFVNRDSQAILKEFELSSIPDPRFMNPEYMLISVLAMKLNLQENFKAKFLHHYKWLKDINRLKVLVIRNLSKQLPFYQTEYLEESLNFQNIQLKEGSQDFVVKE